jgi:hypothetical protein
MKGINIVADKNRTLRFTINTMIQFKKDRHQDFATALTSMSDTLDMELLRYLYYIGLKWEDKDLTEEQTGDVMDAIIENDGIEGLAQHLSDAIEMALGQSKGSPDPNKQSH